jgi:hypothetical protein
MLIYCTNIEDVSIVSDYVVLNNLFNLLVYKIINLNFIILFYEICCRLYNCKTHSNTSISRLGEGFNCLFDLEP